MKINNRLTILYADDNEDSCLMLKTLLGFSGIDVLCVNTVKEAFHAAQNKRFDLYLLDNRFSDGNGLDLCRRLREFDSQTPIVFYSGDAQESDCQKGLAAGANEYLIKPVSNTVAPTIFKLVAHVTETTQQWAN
ncbi:MAG: response regulator [Pyrinomonadaceae bacterium]